MAEISPLRRRMIDDMTVRNLSPATLMGNLVSGEGYQILLSTHDVAQRSRRICTTLSLLGLGKDGARQSGSQALCIRLGLNRRA